MMMANCWCDGAAYALTCIHTIVTMIGMRLFARIGMFERKTILVKQYVVLVFMYIAYIVFSNLSLQYNTVGFYQITKILITPTVLSLEFLLKNKRQTIYVCCAIFLVCLGVSIATVRNCASQRCICLGVVYV